MEEELAKLQQQLRAEQRRREEAESRVLEEQCRREEEQRRREEEQRRREEEQRRREEEQRRREEVEGRVLEEQRRREEAEERAKMSQPLTLQQYLETCHSICLAMEVVTDRTLTTQGDTTDPTGRIYPQRISPWIDFVTRQQEIWDRVPTDCPFVSQSTFPSQHQLEYVGSRLKPIDSEMRLREFERDAVEEAVQTLINEAYEDSQLRSSLDLQGTVAFQSHTNLGKDQVDFISKPMEQMSIENSDFEIMQPARNSHRRARGTGGLADQFCIYMTSDGRKAPALAIEYKAPHKLTMNEVTTGLESEILPARDVINKDGKGFVFASRSLTAAVVTQLFSYMIGKGIQYGYVCTGETFVFLHIPSDPTVVYYHVCVPKLDFSENDGMWRHTAVAQVFAFTLQAIRAGLSPVAQRWHDAAAGLSTWAVEYDDILKKIPPSVRKEPSASPYKPQRWGGFQRSPIQTRSRGQCQQPNLKDGRRDQDDEERPPSPTPNRPDRDEKNTASSGTGSGRQQQQQRRGRQRGQRGQGGQQHQRTQHKIQGQPFCTQKCLRGLACGNPIDKNCPNSNLHGQRHINRQEFLRLIRAQLAVDRGPDANCVPVHLFGALGALFKVRLSTHGYTLVAKGMESFHLARLRHENKLYDRLWTIQGKYVPVCLGRVDLVLPYYYDGGVFKHFMFLSWAGQPLLECIDRASDGPHIVDAVTAAFKELHKLRVLHCDAEPRNIVYDTNSGNLMIVDFERSEFRGSQPLGLSLNGQNRKRERGLQKQKKEDPFAQELQSVVSSVSGCIGYGSVEG